MPGCEADPGLSSYQIPICRRLDLNALREKRSDLGASIVAFFDLAQNEDEFNVPSPAYLILSEVEGRTTPMQA